MKTREIYGGNYLSADDLKDKGDVGVTIAEVTIASFDDGKKKALLHFKGTDKTLPLNLTNANTLEELTGSDETDDWKGVRICLYATKVDFQGKRVLAVRIKEAANKVPPAKAASPTKAAAPAPVTELTDDDIPFAWLVPFVLPLLGVFA